MVTQFTRDGGIEASEASLRRPTNMQWYLSHAGNTVHLAALSPQRMSRDDLLEVLVQAVALDPDLALSDLRGPGILAGGSGTDGPERLASVCSFEEVSRILPDPARYLVPEGSGIFDDPARPSIRLRCTSLAEGADGPVGTVLSVAVSHALVDGAGLANLARGRDAARPVSLPFAAPGGTGAPRILGLLAPALALVHLVLAHAARRKTDGFGFQTARLDRALVRAAAARLGVSQRSLLFACVLDALLPHRRGRRVRFAYAVLGAGSADAFFHARVNYAVLPLARDLAAFTRDLDALLARRDAAAVGINALVDRILGFHRRLMARAPWLYGTRFFQYAPYDLELSLLPPLRPSGPFARFRDATLYAGCDNGATPICIFLPSAGGISLGLWVEEQHGAAVAAIPETLAALARGEAP